MWDWHEQLMTSCVYGTGKPLYLALAAQLLAEFIVVFSWDLLTIGNM